MPDINNIETLQSKVDLVKNDLDALKQETNEWTKKTKTEAIEKNVTAAKEAITKKLEELKKLGEAANKTDIDKLEALLATLDSLTTLKIAVTAPVEVSKNNEAVDNFADFESITKGIAELKTMSIELKTLIDEYTGQKGTLSETEKTAKQKDIETKKVALENKRREIQDIIDKIKKGRKDMNLDDIPDETVKTALKQQKENEEKNLADHQKQLDDVYNPAATFREKFKNGVGKTWEKIKEGANKTRERAKEHPKTAIVATAGIGLLIRGISRLFRKKKKSETSEEGEGKTEKKGFRNRWYGKALKWGLIGTGIWFVGKGLLIGKRPRSKTEGTDAGVENTLTSTENAAESFEKLMKDRPQEAEKLNKVGTRVNDFYDEIYKFNDGTSPSGLEEAKLGKGKEKYAGAIPHILENTFATIDDMEGQRGYFTICAYQDRVEIKKQFANMIGNGAGKVVSSVLGLFGISGAITADNVSEKVSTLIGGENTLEKMHMVFRKILKVMSYTNYAENAFLTKDIETEVKAGKKLAKKDADDKYTDVVYPTDAKEREDLMTDIEYNFSDYKIGDKEVSELRSEFRAKTLKEIYNDNIETKDIFAYNYDIKDDVESLNDKRDKTMIDLEKNQKDALKDLSKNCEDEIADGFRESTKKLFPFLHLTQIVYDKSSIRKTIKEDAGFKKMLEDFRKKFTDLESKSDINEVKKEVDNYYATLKELHTTQNSIVDMTDKDGNFVTTAITAVRSSFTGIPYCFQHGYKLMTKGHYIKSAMWYYGGVSSIAVLGNLTGLSNVGVVGPIVRGATYVTLAPIKATWKAVNIVFPKTYAMSNLSNMVPAYVLRGYYNTPDKLFTGLSNGLSYQKAYSIYKFVGKGTEKGRSFLTEVLGVETRDAQFIGRMEKIVFKDGKMTQVGKDFLNESFTRPGILSTKKTLEVTGDLDKLVSKYEGIIQSTAQSEAAISKISTIAASTENLGNVTALAGEYTGLLTKADNVNSLTYKILQKWGTADGDAAMYLTNTEQIAKAKTYAEKVIELNKGSVETTKIGEAWNGAKKMFKDGMEKIKNLFTKNPTMSPEMKVGLEKSIVQSEAETEAITTKTVEKAAENTGGTEAKAVAAVVKDKLSLWVRILKRSPLLIDGIINIFNGIGLEKEAAEIKKINVERASVREEKATFTLALAGVELTVFAVGVAMCWNPAGRVILAVTGAIEAFKYGVNKYYEVVETYYRNFEDFKRMYMAHIKQEIISKEARGDGIDISLQENFQESVSAVFGGLCHGEGKKTLSLKTREDAIRALIRMEECENYPYATLNLESFKGTEYEDLQKEINIQSTAMKNDSVTRFNYIKGKYGEAFISKARIESANGKAELDRVLFESRQYLKMKKDDPKSGEDIESYKKDVLAKLKTNEGFTKLETLYAANPLQFHKIMKSLPYFSYLIQQQKPEFYANYDKIKTNMDYVVQYYNYKTFGLLPSDIPDITVEADKVDYTMLETFFLDFKIKPTGFTKENLESAFANGQIDIMTPDMVEAEEGVSPSIGQNILYRTAKEVLGGYCGKNNLDDLKNFYTPAERTRNGIYYEDGSWKLNQTSNRYSVSPLWRFDAVGLGYLSNVTGVSPADWDKSFATDEGLNDIANITKLSTVVGKFTQDNYTEGNLIDTDTGTAEGKINKEYGKMINAVVTEELVYRKPENIAKYKNDALNYIKENSDGKYIPLSSDLIGNLTKAGIANTGYYYYKRDGTKLTALEAVVGAIPTFWASKTCGLTSNIEKYQVKEVAYSAEIKEKVSTIDGLISKLSTTILLDDEDLDLQGDIKKMIAAKGVKRMELKVEMSHMDQNKAKELLDAQYDAFETFFENTYIMILHCASSGSSNDVDDYDDYLSISNYSTGSLLDFKTDMGTTQASVSIPDFIYIDEFNAIILKYKIPGKNKTVPDLLNSKEAADVELGKKYAYVVLRSILESAMLKYDDSGAKSTGVCNAGSGQNVDVNLLVKRLIINGKDVKDVKKAKDAK